MNFYVIDKVKLGAMKDVLGIANAVKAQGFSTGPALRCPMCGRYLTMLKWLPPYRIELEIWGAEYADIVDIGDVMIASERFARLFQQSGLRGLGVFEPVEVLKTTFRKGKPKQALPNYYLSSVTYSPTTVDQQASHYVWSDESRVCPICLFDRLKRFERIVIKQDTWNGDAIFFPRGGTRLMASEQFKSFYEEHGFLGIVFNPADQERHDYFPWEKE